MFDKYDALLQDAFKYKKNEIDEMSEYEYLLEINKCKFIAKIKNN